MGATQEFTSGYGRGLTVAAAATGVVTLGAVAVQDGAREALRLLPLVALVVLAVWALLWRPAVEVSDGELVVRNVLSTVRVPWPTYRGVTRGWSLVVHTTDGDVQVAVAPRGSAAAGALRRRGADDDVAPTGGPPAGDRPVRSYRPTAETVGDAIEARHDALVRAGYLDGAERARTEHGLRPTRRVHVLGLGAAVVLAAAGVAVLVTG
ncbi:hypothetical protein [Cellulomonas shaoxiangyii]|uniref:PH domain-containing protein n=1 Tax=Cellulomonas shaoxiangyii TaxID=2566013 RepID=A0A4P7SMB4_9CELL|nr:hypothetical protein [Cellulomonas shaoxiangyii]QCB94356.1 hypothetical protein E5225_13120 [Cellulomonas shaoxiangyii]TGY85195.1 hypothetical protein E5226_07705 [Cellulomonas shaoxiangyii]